MVVSAGVATFASTWALCNKGAPGMIGIAILVLLAAIGVRGFIKNQNAHS